MYSNSTLTDALISSDLIPGKGEPIERIRLGNGLSVVYDDGVHNIGVRPTTEDLCVGGTQALDQASQGLPPIVPFLGNDQTDF